MAHCSLEQALRASPECDGLPDPSAIPYLGSRRMPISCRVCAACTWLPSIRNDLDRIPVELMYHFPVMPGLVPGIHVFVSASKAWMAGTSPAMTIGVGPFNRDMLI
jgi:hypothetical protein